MNINTEHIIHASDCSLWRHDHGIYICDCGSLMRARYSSPNDLNPIEWEMIILHEMQIDLLEKNNLPKDEIPEENVYEAHKKRQN